MAAMELSSCEKMPYSFRIVAASQNNNLFTDEGCAICLPFDFFKYPPSTGDLAGYIRPYFRKPLVWAWRFWFHHSRSAKLLKSKLTRHFTPPRPSLSVYHSLSTFKNIKEHPANNFAASPFKSNSDKLLKAGGKCIQQLCQIVPIIIIMIILWKPNHLSSKTENEI